MASMSGVLRFLVIGAAFGGLSACEQFGNPVDLIQGKRTTPDEFQVLVRAPLRMPGSGSLPEPRLGEASPLEPDPRSAAAVALLGSDPVLVSSAGSSAGEQALLQAANASSNQSEIRTQILEENEVVDANKPYEPPTVGELLGFGEKTPEDAIDPAEEARRLQAAGRPAPVDPNDVPVNAQAPRDTSPGLSYQTDDGRPQNTLPNAPTETGF